MNPCPKCVAHLAAHPYIVGAAASVGIERKRSTPDMVRIYMDRVHREEGH